MANEITKADLDRFFTYHAPQGDQAERYTRIRVKAKELAELILELTPTCPDQTSSIRKLRDSIIWAEAAIACNETTAY